MSAVEVIDLQIDFREMRANSIERDFSRSHYDPEIGRWTSKDPILFNGQQTNLYGYSFSDPINFIDPSGLAGSMPGIYPPEGGTETGCVGCVGSDLATAIGVCIEGACTFIPEPRGKFLCGAAGALFMIGVQVGADLACEKPPPNCPARPSLPQYPSLPRR